MSFAESDTVPSRVGLHSRVALALAHATVHSRTQPGVIAFGSTVHEGFSVVDYVQELLNASPNEWNAFIQHKFPGLLANGTAPLNGFRHYMVQDATYLEYYYRMEMEAVSKSGTFKDMMDVAAKVSSHLGYVTTARDDCTKKLGVPKDDVANEPKSQELQNSIKFYEDVIKNSDSSWLDMHIILLPCILGYYTIASKLRSDPVTIRDTIYFDLWVQANASPSSATKYKDFINNNITGTVWTAKKDEWIKKFKEACKYETAFFGLAGGKSVYNIVSNGTYKIHSYRSDGPYLVSTKPNTVTTQKTDPKDEGKWILTNSVEGYTIQNVLQKSYLYVSITDPIKPSYEVSASTQQRKWSINTVQVYETTEPHKEYPAYQLIVPEKSQFVVDAGNDVEDLKVLVTNNSQISSQLWKLEKVA